MWGEPKPKFPLIEEAPKHRKKKTKPAPKKSNHKHDYIHVLLQYEYSSHDYATGLQMTRVSITHGGKCSICGKINWGWEDYWRLHEINTTPEGMKEKYPDLEVVDVKCPWSK